MCVLKITPLILMQFTKLLSTFGVGTFEEDAAVTPGDFGLGKVDLVKQCRMDLYA